jgi:hypothetical protein
VKWSEKEGNPSVVLESPIRPSRQESFRVEGLDSDMGDLKIHPDGKREFIPFPAYGTITLEEWAGDERAELVIQKFENGNFVDGKKVSIDKGLSNEEIFERGKELLENLNSVLEEDCYE